MVILHLNHYQIKPVRNLVIRPLIKELNKHGILNIYFDAEELKNGNWKSRVIFFILSIKVFFEKVFKNTFTKIHFNFFNILEQVSIVSSDLILKKIKKKPDIIILYWISGSINMKTVYKLQKKTSAKVYWYFMDKAPMTGGCHYTWDCKQFATSGCKDCSAFKFNFLSFIAFKNFKYRQKYIGKLNITALSPTRETSQLITKSILFHQKEKIYIPIGIDQTTFIQKEIRTLEFCNINREVGKTYFLAGANNINDKRKGLQFFIDSLRIIKERDNNLFKQIRVIIIGKFKYNPFDDIEVDNSTLGYVNEERLIQLYNFVDAYVCPSIEDSGPLMVNQALTCGTPVIAFNTGVARDLITDDNAGYLASMLDIEDFAKGLIMIINRGKKDQNSYKKNNRDMTIQKVGMNVSSSKLIDHLIRKTD
ncbi:MAG: glycosyltransferase [Chitinophagaceae bacterium]